MTRTIRTIVSTALGAVALVAAALPAAAHEHNLTTPGTCVVLPYDHLANGRQPIHDNVHQGAFARNATTRVSIAADRNVDGECG